MNKDSISLLADRQLRKYLQPHCNAAKWILENRAAVKGTEETGSSQDWAVKEDSMIFLCFRSF